MSITWDWGDTKGIKLWLDDLRPLPLESFHHPGWAWIKTAEDAIKTFKVTNPGEITEIDLDHDLGDYPLKTGYDVLLWIEEQVATNPDFVCPKIWIHTANTSTEKKMRACVDKIEKMISERK